MGKKKKRAERKLCEVACVDGGLCLFDSHHFRTEQKRSLCSTNAKTSQVKKEDFSLVWN